MQTEHSVLSRETNGIEQNMLEASLWVGTSEMLQLFLRHYNDG